MKKKRQQEIAFLLLSEEIRNKAKSGIHLGPEARREIGKAAKKIGVSQKEMLEFIKIQLKGLTKETFKK